MPIFDQGYQHWKGSLSGRGWRWLAITRQGLRGQLKGSIVLRLLLLTAWLPALTLVVTLALWGLLEQKSQTMIRLLQSILPTGITADPYAYRHAVWTISYSMFFKVEIFYIMLLVVLVGPNLISRDLRFNALPLYFSRPLTRLDYFLGKLGVIGVLVAAVAVVPAVVAYILGVCFSLDLGVIRDTWRLLPASILYGLVIVVSAGTLMLALSSLSRRSLYVSIAWVGLWVISSMVAGALEGIHHHALAHANKTEAAQTDWRPLCSYTANLERLGEALLGADAAWVEIGRAVELQQAALKPLIGKGGSKMGSKEINERKLADQFVQQYPWIWSAGVLAGLWGISLWTLSTRVKTLDRLR